MLALVEAHCATYHSVILEHALSFYIRAQRVCASRGRLCRDSAPEWVWSGTEERRRAAAMPKSRNTMPEFEQGHRRTMFLVEVEWGSRVYNVHRK